jgi:hypothetical protein
MYQIRYLLANAKIKIAKIIKKLAKSANIFSITLIMIPNYLDSLANAKILSHIIN